MCIKCRRELERSHQRHVLYWYNDFFRAMLFRYKALGDLALASLFLMDDCEKLKRRYHDYTIVLVPSLQEDNFKRGFAFLPWMFNSLQLPMISPFYKIRSYKQATSKHREEISEIIQLKEPLYLKGKKLLVVDDVMTSGYTMKTCLQLLRKRHPKTLDYLVLATKKENYHTCIENIEKGIGNYERKSKKIFK